MKPVGRKRKRQSGFSLAETLVALIIILLVSAIVAGAMPAAKDAYFNVLESADAQVFLSTTLTVLRDELAMATDIDLTTNPGTIIYTNPITGDSKITFSEGAYRIETYLNLDGEMTERGRPLVTDRARSKLKIKEQPSITYANDMITISSFEVLSERTNTVVAKLENPYYIRVLVERESTPGG